MKVLHKETLSIAAIALAHVMNNAPLEWSLNLAGLLIQSTGKCWLVHAFLASAFL